MVIKFDNICVPVYAIKRIYKIIGDFLLLDNRDRFIFRDKRNFYYVKG